MFKVLYSPVAHVTAATLVSDEFQFLRSAVRGVTRYVQMWMCAGKVESMQYNWPYHVLLRGSREVPGKHPIVPVKALI